MAIRERKVPKQVLGKEVMVWQLTTRNVQDVAL
jgi:hypothetical protein